MIACIDLEKAFDTVNHKALLIKVAKLGITGHPLKWINNLLENRIFQINIVKLAPEKGKTSKVHSFNIMIYNSNLKPDIPLVTNNKNKNHAIT